MGTTLTWTNPTSNTDGGAYDAATENAGYELAFDADTQGAVSLPFSFGNSFDFSVTEAYQTLKSGPHAARLAVVNKAGLRSTFSEAAPFLKVGVPNPPTNLGVA